MDVLHESWRQHTTKQQLYGHLPPVRKTIQVRQVRHAEHGWRSKDELTSDVHRWNSFHGRAIVGQPARIYIQQLCAIQYVTLTTSRDRWTIKTGGERGSRKSVLDMMMMMMMTYIYIYTWQIVAPFLYYPRCKVIFTQNVKTINKSPVWFGLVWFVGFYGISTFVGYLTPNPFLCE